MNDPNVGLFQLIVQGGAIAVLAIACWLWLKGAIITRRELDNCIAERDERIKEERREKEAWRAMALHGAKISKDAVETLKGTR